MSTDPSPRALVSNAYDKGYNQGWFGVPWSPVETKDDCLRAHQKGYAAGRLDRQIDEARR